MLNFAAITNVEKQNTNTWESAVSDQQLLTKLSYLEIASNLVISTENRLLG